MNSFATEQIIMNLIKDAELNKFSRINTPVDRINSILNRQAAWCPAYASQDILGTQVNPCDSYERSPFFRSIGYPHAYQGFAAQHPVLLAVLLKALVENVSQISNELDILSPPIVPLLVRLINNHPVIAHVLTEIASQNHVFGAKTPLSTIFGATHPIIMAWLKAAAENLVQNQSVWRTVSSTFGQNRDIDMVMPILSKLVSKISRASSLSPFASIAACPSLTSTIDQVVKCGITGAESNVPTVLLSVLLKTLIEKVTQLRSDVNFLTPAAVPFLVRLIETHPVIAAILAKTATQSQMFNIKTPISTIFGSAYPIISEWLQSVAETLAQTLTCASGSRMLNSAFDSPFGQAAVGSPFRYGQTAFGGAQSHPIISEMLNEVCYNATCNPSVGIIKNLGNPIAEILREL